MRNIVTEILSNDINIYIYILSVDERSKKGVIPCKKKKG